MAAKEPLFSQEMQDVSEIEDSKAVFMVKITGEQPITVTWSDEDGEIAIDDVKFCADELDDGCYMLSINEINFETDSGLYRCEAKNKHGKTISEATLYIEEMPGQAKTLVHKVEHKD